MWEEQQRLSKPAATKDNSFLELVAMFVVCIFGIMAFSFVREAAFDRDTLKCRFTQGCVVPETPADAGALAETGATSTGAVTRRGNVTVINLEQLDCEDSFDFAPDYVENTKYLDGKCYMRTDGVWEELAPATIRYWQEKEKKRLEDQALQDKLNSD